MADTEGGGGFRRTQVDAWFTLAYGLICAGLGLLLGYIIFGG